jgi:dimeric dUTPase (all-alpha-NTP-PPase superfamily)
MVTLTKPYTIVELTDSHDFSEMEFGKGNSNSKAHGFLDEQGKCIAYAWYSVNNHSLSMDMIEVLEKEQGHGTAIVQFLFVKLNLNRMEGLVLKDSSLRPYYFWLSLGSTMEVADEDEFMEYFQEGLDVDFELTRENLVRP